MMPVELLPLVAHDGVRGQARRLGGGSPAGRARWRRGPPRRIARSPRSVEPLDLGAARHAAPRRVHAVEDVLRRRLAREQHERARSSRPPPRRAAHAEALRLVHRAAAGGDRGERLARAPDRCRRRRSASRRPRRLRRRRLPPPRERRRCEECVWAATAVSSPSCSGNAWGSPASLNASTARMADAV